MSYTICSQVSVTLIEATHQILGTFDKTLVQYTTNLFQTRKVKLLTDNSVTGIKENLVLLADGSKLPYGVCVWSTGVKPTDLTASLNIEKARGRIVVDEHLRVPGLDDVYAAGDCAAARDKPLAPLAQVDTTITALVLFVTRFSLYDTMQVTS
jgi:NADH:ubiquinone reductase (non-electrogenic)